MNRRTLLETAGTVGAVALAGCASTDGDDGTPEGTATPTDTAPPQRTDTSFTVQQSRSGQQRDAAEVTTDGTTITVEGTIWGSDGCTTAELAAATYDADELTVAVATTAREPTAASATDGEVACTQAIVEIDYRMTATFDAALPGSTVVTHDHGDGPEQVTTASL